jgi:hypothetical protein
MGPITSRTIPVEAVYSTVGEQSPKRVDLPGQVSHETIVRFGQPTAFIVAAPDIGGAAEVAADILSGRRPVPDPVQQDHTLWVVLCFGVGGGYPPPYALRAIRLSGNHLLVEYAKSRHPPLTADMRPYVFWIPLDSLPAGRYELQLREVGSRRTSTVRSQAVQQL